MVKKIRAHLQCNVWEGNAWMTLQQSYQANNTFRTSDVRMEVCLAGACLPCDGFVRLLLVVLEDMLVVSRPI